jgi:hypothetical protein
MQTIDTLKRYIEARKVAPTYHQYGQAIGLNTDERMKQVVLEALGHTIIAEETLRSFLITWEKVVDDSQRRIGYNRPQCHNAMRQHTTSHHLRRKRLGLSKAQSLLRIGYCEYNRRLHEQVPDELL